MESGKRTVTPTAPGSSTVVFRFYGAGFAFPGTFTSFLHEKNN